MHLLLTDRLACPGCAGDLGLILLAKEVRNQRVLDGELGCAKCKRTYPVRDGFADLRIPPRSEAGTASPHMKEQAEDPDETLRLGALLGVTQGPGTILLCGPAATQARPLSRLLQGMEVVALHNEQRRFPEAEGVSRMVAGSTLPFLAESFRGVLLSGEVTETDFHEAFRVVAPGGRVVVLDASAETRRWAKSRDMEVLLDEAGIIVAQAGKSGAAPLVTLRGL